MTHNQTVSLVYSKKNDLSQMTELNSTFPISLLSRVNISSLRLFEMMKKAVDKDIDCGLLLLNC